MKKRSEVKGETSGIKEATNDAKLDTKDESHGKQRIPKSVFEKSKVFESNELLEATALTGASFNVGTPMSSAEIALALTSPLTKETTNTTR